MLNEYVVAIVLTLAADGTNIPLELEVHLSAKVFPDKVICEKALDTPEFSNALRSILREPTPGRYLLDVDRRCVTKSW